MDSMSACKVSNVRDAIEQACDGLMFLPPYSLDFKPIEMAVAKLMALQRKAATEPLMRWGTPLPIAFLPSRKPSVEATFKQQDMIQTV